MKRGDEDWMRQWLSSQPAEQQRRLIALLLASARADDGPETDVDLQQVRRQLSSEVDGGKDELDL